MGLGLLKFKTYPTHIATLKKRIENEQVYDFLAGLDPGFDQIRVQVLA
jgi:hypothetical protein